MGVVVRIKLLEHIEGSELCWAHSKSSKILAIILLFFAITIIERIFPGSWSAFCSHL